jgi:hypothetical protein
MSQGGEPARSGIGLAKDGDEAPTQQLGLAAVGDRCASCGAPLASDQRYCVVCGERRGKARFTVAEPTAPAVDGAAVPPRRQRRARASSGFTLIAGIATLLIAMGVGVLIGHNNNSAAHSAGSSQPLHITLGNTNAGTAAASTPSASTPASTKKGKHSSKAGSKATKGTAKSSAAASAKASSAASKVLGGANKVAPATVTQGGQCSAGSAGCASNGKFNGSFFGN